MVKLETVEDFEKAKLAFEDPGGCLIPITFCVQPYSYCYSCDDVVEFDAPNPQGLVPYTVHLKDISITVRCVSCNMHFVVTDLDMRNNIYWGTKSSKDSAEIPSHFLNEMKKLNSREMQQSFFTVILEKKIKEEKGKLRKIQNDIQKLAKLRM